MKINILILIIMIFFIAGCEDKEVSRIKSEGYNPAIPSYDVSDFCVAAASNSSMNISARTLVEFCFSKEYGARDNLNEMQKEGKPIHSALWNSCLDTSVGQSGKPSYNGSYSILYNCVVGKISPIKKLNQTKSTDKISKSKPSEKKKTNAKMSDTKKLRMAQVIKGKKLHFKIINKYPSLGTEYREPFISGGLTSNPKCLISVPSNEWGELSDQQKLQLFDYAASLIPVVKANPDKYSGLGPNAPIASRVRQNISGMGNASWAIDVGEFANGGKDLLSGNLIRSL